MKGFRLAGHLLFALCASCSPDEDRANPQMEDVTGEHAVEASQEQIDPPATAQENGHNRVSNRDGEPAVLSVVVEEVGWNVSHDLRVAVWSNGDVIWSKDPVVGGPPYFRSQVDKQVVQATAELVSKRFVDADLGRTHVLGVHARNSVLQVTSVYGHKEIATFHEQDRGRARKLGETELAWNQLWDLVSDLVPANGTACDRKEFTLRWSWE